MAHANNIPVTDEMYQEYQPKTVDEAVLNANINEFLYKKTDKVQNWRVVFDIVCLKCGTRFESTAHEVCCPHCGQNRKGATLVRDRDVVAKKNITLLRFENTNLPDNALLMRVFTVVCYHPEAKPLYSYPPMPDKGIRENARYYFGKKKVAFEVREGKQYKTKASLGWCLTDFHRTNIIVNAHSDQELKIIVENSCLRDSGLITAWGLDKEAPLFNTTELAYINGWYQTHSIKLFLDAKLYNMVRTCCFAAPHGLRGNTAQRILHLNDVGYEIVQKYNVDFQEANAIRTMCENDNAFSMEAYQKLSKNLNVASCARLSSYGISWRNMLHYVGQTYIFDGAAKYDPIDMWLSYLKKAKELGYDMSQDDVKYPENLYEAHRNISNEYEKHEH